MAEIGADPPSSAISARAGRSRLRRAVTRRTVVRTGAVALAVLGVVALVAHPATRTRAEARFTVPVPLVVGEAVGAILTRADGATATAHGRSVIVAVSDADRDAARARAEVLARAGLDGARQQFIVVETRQVEKARSDRAQAAAQLAQLARRTGLTDPVLAYQQRLDLVRRLERQRAAAVAARQSVASIDAQLAVNQQAVFELRLQVTRNAELLQVETTAERGEIAATAAIDTAKRAVGLAPVRVSDHATGTGVGIAAGVAAIVIAGIVFLVGGRLPRRAASRTAEAETRIEPEPVVEREVVPDAVAEPVPDVVPELVPELVPEAAPVAVIDEMALVASEAAALEARGLQGSRYLEFYRALAPAPAPSPQPSPSAEREAAPGELSVDLVHEEAVEANGDHAPEPVPEHDGSRP